MENRRAAFSNPRVAFLFLIGIGTSLIFYWMIKGFLLALVIAAALASLVHPLYLRLSTLFGNRKGLASGVTVLLSLVLVIIPLLFFVGVLVSEAVHISESAAEWVQEEAQESGNLRQHMAANQYLKQLLPYQDQIMAKASQLAGQAGAFVAHGLAAGAKITAVFFLMLFVMLYAMFFFLVHGRALIDEVLRFTPLSDDDKSRLLSMFASVSRATLKGTLIIGVVQGGLAALSFWAAGIKGVVFWGAVMAVLSVIPALGTALVWIPAVIYLALEGQITAAVGVALWCAIIVGTADNVLRPRLVGRDTEMPDLLVLLTTLGGLALFGIAGIVVGPLIGALYMTICQLWGSAVDEISGNARQAATAIGTEAVSHEKE